jgi:hypothetical protein
VALRIKPSQLRLGDEWQRRESGGRGRADGTAAGSATLQFSSPPGCNTGPSALVTDTKTPTVIPAGTYITSVSGSTTTMSANATGAGVGSGDPIEVTPLYEIIQDINATPPTYGRASDYRVGHGGHSERQLKHGEGGRRRFRLPGRHSKGRARNLLCRRDYRGSERPDSQRAAGGDERDRSRQ